jgi:hypothetical protein
MFVILVISLLVNSAFAIASTCDANHPALGRWELVNILKRNGFSNVIDEYTELKRVGNIRVADSCLTLFVYSREFQAGSNLHEVKRLLVFRNHEYIGMYAIDDVPKGLNGNILEFPGSTEEGNSIVFSSEVPPEKIYLDGEIRRLFK